MVREKIMDYRWGRATGRWLLRHHELEELLEAFLRYVAANTTAHRFLGFKCALSIRADGRCCYLLLRPRGLVLTATRDDKGPMRHAINSPADFTGGLQWILNLEDPKVGAGETT